MHGCDFDLLWEVVELGPEPAAVAEAVVGARSKDPGAAEAELVPAWLRIDAAAVEESAVVAVCVVGLLQGWTMLRAVLIVVAMGELLPTRPGMADRNRSDH